MLYTERLLGHNTSGVKSVAVPGGKRSIVMSVLVCNGSTSARQVDIAVGGFYILTELVPGVSNRTFTNLRCVAYAGEVLSITHGGTGVWSSIHAYVLDESQGGGLHAGQLPTEPGPLPPLPIEDPPP